MIYLAISPRGLHEALQVARLGSDFIWCSAEAITESEFRVRHLPGVTRLAYSPSMFDQVQMERAIDSIAEHHPGESIWIEGAVRDA